MACSGHISGLPFSLDCWKQAKELCIEASTTCNVAIVIKALLDDASVSHYSFHLVLTHRRRPVLTMRISFLLGLTLLN